MRTLDAELKRYKGIGPGFDFLRIGLAVAIVGFHCILQLGHYRVRETPLWFAEYGLVPMFFALSGFLVAGSAMRLSLKNFLINRGLRIVPALAVDIAVCALVIGPIMTTVPLLIYFTHPDFFRYFLNITGWIHFLLPGVFKDHPNVRVNGALWTVPYEVLCYLIMSVLIVTRWVMSPRMVTGFAIVFVALSVATKAFGGAVPAPILLPLQFIFVSVGTRLILAFLIGILIYQLRSVVPYSWPLFLLCCGLCALAAFGHMDTRFTRLLSHQYALLPVLAYMTCFLGVTNIPVPKFVHSGDYSYGIYLYHDPLLQVVISLMPGLLLRPYLGTVGLFLFGLPAVALLATFSWHFVEKPILGLRKRFSFVARVRGVASDADASVAPPSRGAAGRHAAPVTAGPATPPALATTP